ncbi:MAG: hypothetical protein IH594_13170, partial [Bacteroidales bacterium]|nr:hypothetical protein [Bacteroidales bacterium]
MKTKRLIGFCQILMCSFVLFVACNRSTNETNLNRIETSSFTDSRDGKIYKTVKIEDQWVMAENLAYKPDKGNFWSYENNESNISIYGYLYDWETAINIAPEGWHLPTSDEFIAIRKALGCKRSLITYLEEIYPKLIDGGSSGLNMLLGGMRTCDGKFMYLGEKARFWTSTNNGLKTTGYSEKTVYGLDSNKDGVPHGLRKSTAPMMFQNRQFPESCQGFSVRLFKD